MESKRQLKLARIIQKEMAVMLLNPGSIISKNLMITVTQVRVSPDSGLAKIYVSVFPGDQKDIIGILNQQSYEYRKELAHKLRNQMRRIPDIVFYLDDSLDYAEKMDDLFKKISD